MSRPGLPKETFLGQSALQTRSKANHLNKLFRSGWISALIFFIPQFKFWQSFQETVPLLDCSHPLGSLFLIPASLATSTSLGLQVLSFHPLHQSPPPIKFSNKTVNVTLGLVADLNSNHLSAEQDSVALTQISNLHFSIYFFTHSLFSKHPPLSGSIEMRCKYAAYMALPCHQWEGLSSIHSRQNKDKLERFQLYTYFLLSSAQRMGYCLQECMRFSMFSAHGNRRTSRTWKDERIDKN